MLLFTFSLHQCVDITYRVQEERNAGTYLGNVAADTRIMESIPHQDSRLVRFSQLRPAGGAGSSQLFNVSETTGKLYTAQVLNAEELCSLDVECYLIIDIAVQVAESLLRLLKVKVIIEDINDQKPEFPSQSIHLQFSEGDSTMRKPLPNAVDKDVSSKNSNVIYQLRTNRNEPFVLSVSNRLDGTSELSISVREKLDREAKDRYLLEVIAKDQGSPSRQSILFINISVTDLNDNAPVFTQKIYNVTISNDEPLAPIPIVAVSATDADKGRNGEITYRFSPRTPEAAREHFILDEMSGEIYQRKIITSGEQSTYKLFVEAVDGANPPLSALGMVVISVSNTQNTAPEILINFVSSSAQNTAVISESVSKDSFIAYVQVNDHDLGENGEVRCDLRHGKFQLQSLGAKEYKVIVKKPLDRESQAYYNVTITCQDKGVPPLFSKASFSIEVLDINDNAPMFTQHIYTASFPENNPKEMSISTVTATDRDAGNNAAIVYFLDDPTSRFKIGELTGVLTVESSFDREVVSFVNLKVLARDLGKPSFTASATVRISILDTNDVSPQFTRSLFEFSTYENQRHSVPVGFVNATDPDLGLGGQLSYSLITDGKHFLPFRITNDGFLSVVEPLDREVQDLYKFQVMVVDHGTPQLNSTVYVLVNVIDENDNTPDFVFPSQNNFSMTVYYYPYAENEITVLQAHDNDSGENARLQFGIVSGNERKLFAINRYTGVLSFGRAATVADSGTYTLRLAVSDSGTPMLSSTANLSLVVIVNNETTLIPEDFQMHKGVIMQHNLLIVIVLTAITASVAIVVITTICILRRNDRRNQPPGMGLGPHQVSKQSRCMPKHFDSNHDLSLAMSSDSDRKRPIGLRHQTFRDETKNERAASSMGGDIYQAATPTRHQVSFQEVNIVTGRMAPDCRSDVSTGSSNNDSGRGWSDGDVAPAPDEADGTNAATKPYLSPHQEKHKTFATLQRSFNSANHLTTLRSSFKPNISAQTPWAKDLSNMKLATVNNARASIDSLQRKTTGTSPRTGLMLHMPHVPQPRIPQNQTWSQGQISVPTSPQVPTNLSQTLVSQPDIALSDQGPVDQGRVCGDHGTLAINHRRQIDEQSCSSSDSGQTLERVHEGHTYNDPTHFMLKDVIV